MIYDYCKRFVTQYIFFCQRYLSMLSLVSVRFIISHIISELFHHILQFVSAKQCRFLKKTIRKLVTIDIGR